MTHAALAVAAGTGRVDYLAGTAAPLAGPGRLNHPKGGPALYPNLTCSFTVWAGLRAGTLGCTGAAAVRTLLQPLDGNLLGTAMGRLHKGQVQIDIDIVAPDGCVRIAGTGGSAESAESASAAEEGIKNIAYIKAAHAAHAAKATGAGAGARSIGRIYSRMTELVVPGAFILVGQHLIGFINLFKFGFGFFITGI